MNFARNGDCSLLQYMYMKASECCKIVEVMRKVCALLDCTIPLQFIVMHLMLLNGQGM
jgi:hypothetical protein